MNPKMSRSILMAASLLFSAAATQAQQASPGIKSASATSKAKAMPAKPPKTRVPLEKQVDINNASKEQLKSLPGVTDTLADRIIAGRPYATKARLVTRAILPNSVYTGIKGLIYAKQPSQGR